jgi:hypothetical protein
MIGTPPDRSVLNTAYLLKESFGQFWSYEQEGCASSKTGAHRSNGRDRSLMRTGAVREFCRSWKNQTEVTVSGLHFIQEDSGPAIGRAIRNGVA